MIGLTDEPLDARAVEAAVASTSAGAIVTFLGTTRAITGDRQTVWLEYDAHRLLATRQLQNLADETKAKWPGSAVAILHRLGRVDPGEASVAIAVAAPHRAEAFDACRFVIDELKQRVPIWKQEHYADGRTEWVHPGVASVWADPTGSHAGDALGRERS